MTGVVTHPFRFAIQGLGLGDPDTVADRARACVALGYEDLYSYDHVGAFDPFAPLVAAALAAPTLRVGPLVLNNEFHHPALLARTAATVDRLTGGRLVLGLGTGYMQSEHDAIGLELRAPGARVERFAESLEVLRALLDTGACRFEGRHHQVAVDDLGIRPVQARVPFLVGGHGRRVVTLAARHADIFQFTGLTHGEGGAPAPGGFPLTEVEERNRWFEEAAGDRLSQVVRSVLVQATEVGPTADTAHVAARWGMDAAVFAGTPFALVGSVQQIVDKLERQRERLGISHVVVRDAEGFAPVVAALAGR